MIQVIKCDQIEDSDFYRCPFFKYVAERDLFKPYCNHPDLPEEQDGDLFGDKNNEFKYSLPDWCPLKKESILIELKK